MHFNPNTQARAPAVRPCPGKGTRVGAGEMAKQAKLSPPLKCEE